MSLSRILPSPLLLFLVAACSSPCLRDECEKIPVIPWDPGSVPSSPGYDSGEDGTGTGSGTGTDTGDPGDTDTTIPREIVSVRSCEVVLEHVPDGSPGQVEVAGSFGGWVPTAMTEGTGGTWSVSLGELAPGEYAFKYIVDGSWEGDPPINVYAHWEGGSENRNLRVLDCALPLLQTVSAAAYADGTLAVEVQVAAAADGVPVDPDAVIVTVGDQTVTPSVDPITGTILISAAGLAPGKHAVRVWASDESGRHAENEPLYVPLWVEDEAFDWRDGLMYFVFTDRFRDGDEGQDNGFYPVDGVSECANYEGGDFLGVIDALEEGYFEALGVRTLWLSPVYENPDGAYLGTDGTHMYSGYHGYWPIAPDGIEGHFGDADATADARLRELIEKAHARGIRVLFDLVLNHVHEDHRYLAEHPEWFTDGCVCGTTDCDWDAHARDCWFTDYLPDVDYRNHALVEQVVADTLTLIQDYDVDAVRVDAAKHMDHVIMRTLSMRLRDDFEAGGGAPFYVVGETYTSDAGLIMDYTNDWELDGQFDFPLYFSIRNTFVSGGTFRDLEGTVAYDAGIYGDAVHSPFLGNHDVERFATAVHGQSGDPWTGDLDDPMADGGGAVTEWDVINRMSMAFAFTLTQPGVPLLYYGDEVGLAGGGDPDNRRMMNFDPYLSANQTELRDRVQAIGAARAESLALRRGARVQLWVDDDLLVYALDNGGGDVAIVAMNKSGSSRSESVPVSSLGVEGVSFEDRKEPGRTMTVSGGDLALSLGSWDYAILVKP